MPAICKEKLEQLLVLHALALKFFIEIVFNGVTKLYDCDFTPASDV